VNDLLIYVIMLDLHMVLSIKFMTVLTEFKKVLSQELKCLFV
jgi:hypothetical protein